jgi:hypothetical protein
MKIKPSKVFFVTSFFPVAIFKMLARLGEITPGRVKVAVLTGLILAIAQFFLSRRFLKYTTYLEKAFLGFLGAGHYSQRGLCGSGKFWNRYQWRSELRVPSSLVSNACEFDGYASAVHVRQTGNRDWHVAGIHNAR